MPGRVKTYYAATQTADVVPVVQRPIGMEDGSYELEELPVIPNVLIGWPSGAGYSLVFPLEPGDHVWLIFNEVAIAQWRESGVVSEPGDLSRHDLSYPWAYPGARPVSKVLLDAPASGEAVLVVPPGGSFRVSTPLAPLADFVAMKLKVETELAAIAAAITALGGSYVPNVAGVGSTTLKAE
jgi:hypothetical protein